MGADLAALCRQAGYSALRRQVSETALKDGGVAADAALQITVTDFDAALEVVQPSGMREVVVEVSRDVRWSDIGGLEDLKRVIREGIIYGIQRPHVYSSMGIRPVRGVLLYGPPGTGKTLLAKAVANECQANFIAVRGPELRSKWFGESEEKARFIFARARTLAPSIIFFDEIDALAPARGRDVSGISDSLVNQLLSELDGIARTEHVFVLAATNRRDLIDEALLRPGRFDLQVEVPLPDVHGRRAIFEVHLRHIPTDGSVVIGDLASSSEGLSGAEIAEVCRSAALKALGTTDFERASPVSMTQLVDEVTALHGSRVRRGRAIGFAPVPQIETGRS